MELHEILNPLNYFGVGPIGDLVFDDEDHEEIPVEFDSDIIDGLENEKEW